MQDRLDAQPDQKEASRQSVLEAIRNSEQIARIDIAHLTGFSPATVTAITSELLAANLIREVTPDEKSAGKRGRPRVLLEINAKAHQIAGVKIAHRTISVLIVDYLGNDLVSNVMPLDHPRMSARDLVAEVMRAVAETGAKIDITAQDLSCISIAMAGQIDAKRRFVYWSSSLTEVNVDLGAELAKQAPCPAFVDNDANLVAMAEQLFGFGRGISDVLVVTLEHGVGLGIILDGKLYRGARGCGAEFGHTKVQFEGALCQCGQRGCLEAYVGDYAILRDAHHLSTHPEAPRSVADVNAAACAGDPIAQSALERARRMFVMGLANLVNVFDPQAIILCGEQTAYSHMAKEKIIEELQRWVVQIDAPLPPIMTHDWGHMMWAKGAAAYAIEQVAALDVRRLSRVAA